MANREQHLQRGGRPKGAKNKFSVTAKDNIAHVFDAIGGLRSMAEWAMDNKTEFYKHYAKLIPLELTGKDGGDLVLRVRVDAVPNTDGN